MWISVCVLPQLMKEQRLAAVTCYHSVSWLDYMNPAVCVTIRASVLGPV